jgi:hypothetical protein
MCMPLTRQVLVWMIGFISSWLHTLNYTCTLAIQHYLSFTQVTVDCCGLLPLWTSFLAISCRELIWNCWELLWAKLLWDQNWNVFIPACTTHTKTGFIWNSLYNCCTDHRKHLRLNCWNVCVELLHSNCRGTDNSEPIIASLPSNDKQTLVLLPLRAFRGFYGFNSYRMGKHATILRNGDLERCTS